MTAQFYGFNPPFIGGAENILSRQEDERLIKNDILQLLLTIPGERVMRPGYGVNLRNFVFENAEEDELSSLRTEIIAQIKREEPRVNVESVDITINSDNNQIGIKIIANLKSDPQTQLIIERFINGATQ